MGSHMISQVPCYSIRERRDHIYYLRDFVTSEPSAKLNITKFARRPHLSNGGEVIRREIVRGVMPNN